jgi:hypothetical protein
MSTETITRPKYTGPRLVPIKAFQPPDLVRQADGVTVRTKDDGYTGPNRFYLNVINMEHRQQQLEATQSAWKAVSANHWDRHKEQDYTLTMSADGLVSDIAAKPIKIPGFATEAAPATASEPCVVLRQYADNSVSVTNTPERVDASRIEQILDGVTKHAASGAKPLEPGQLLLERYRVVKMSREVGFIDLWVDPMASA